MGYLIEAKPLPLPHVSRDFLCLHLSHSLHTLKHNCNYQKQMNKGSRMWCTRIQSTRNMLRMPVVVICHCEGKCYFNFCNCFQPLTAVSTSLFQLIFHHPIYSYIEDLTKS